MLNGELISADSMQVRAVALHLLRKTYFVVEVDWFGRQVYRGLDIGTDKPRADQRALARHHLIDVANIDQFVFFAERSPPLLFFFFFFFFYFFFSPLSLSLVPPTPRQFTAGDFVKLAHKHIADVARRGKVPIVVGGTPFYLNVLVNGLPTPQPTPDHVRAAVTAQLQGLAWLAALELLAAKDPVYAASLFPNDWFAGILPLFLFSSFSSFFLFFP
jgi:tRNA dimethylallyltransferase